MNASLRLPIAALLAALLIPGLAGAQSPVRFGLTAVPLVTWHKTDNPAIESDGPLVGFQYGLLVDYQFDDDGRYALATGVLVSGFGGKLLDLRPDAYSVQEKNRYQYLEIPLTVKLTATEFNYFTFFGQIGVVPGVNIRARGDRTVTPPQINGPFALENAKLPQVNLFNIGLEVGGGARYALGENLNLSTGLLYRNGFVNVYDDGDGDKITLNHVALQVALYF
jgi:hypothetical protein